MSSTTDKKQWVRSHRWLLGGVVGGLAVIGLVLGLTASSSSSAPMSTTQERELQAAMQRYNAGATGRLRAQRASSAAAALGSADETVQGDYDNVLGDENGVAGGLSSLRSNTTSTLTSIAGLAANLQTIRKALAVEVAAGGTTEAGESDAVTVENDVSIFRDNLYGSRLDLSRQVRCLAWRASSASSAASGFADALKTNLPSQCSRLTGVAPKALWR